MAAPNEKPLPQTVMERLAKIRTDRGLDPHETARSITVDPDDPTTAAGALEFVMDVLEVLEGAVGVLAFRVHRLEQDAGSNTPVVTG